MSAADLWNGNFTPLPAILAAHAAERPEAIAVVNDNRSLNYRDFNALVDSSCRISARETMSAGTKRLPSVQRRAPSILRPFWRIACGCRRRSAGPILDAGSTANDAEDCAARIVFVDHDTVRPAGATRCTANS